MNDIRHYQSCMFFFQFFIYPSRSEIIFTNALELVPSSFIPFQFNVIFRVRPLHQLLLIRGEEIRDPVLAKFKNVMNIET